MNPTTGKRHRRVNDLLAGMSPLPLVSNDPRWCNYKQTSEEGEASVCVFVPLIS